MSNIEQANLQMAALNGAEAMRVAVLALFPDTEIIRRNGYSAKADTYEALAHRIRRLDPDTVVTSATGIPPSVADVAAFEKAARDTGFNIVRKGGGGYLHPITERARTVWNAAVHWMRTPPAHVCNDPCPNGDDCAQPGCLHCHCHLAIAKHEASQVDARSALPSRTHIEFVSMRIGDNEGAAIIENKRFEVLPPQLASDEDMQ